jgi:hypothetical protein
MPSAESRTRDAAGNWKAWYDEAIPLAERRYAECVADRKKESGK